MKDSRKRSPSVLLVASQKGGVGKTTTTVSLAYAFAEAGKRVCVVDFDYQGNASQTLGVYEEAIEQKLTIGHALQKNMTLPHIAIQSRHPNIDVIASSIALNKQVRSENGELCQFHLLSRLIDVPEKHDYDIFIVDTHPHIDPLLISALNYAHYVIVPVSPEKYAFQGFEDLAQEMKRAQKMSNKMLTFLGVVLTRFDLKNPTHVRITKSIKESLRIYGFKFFETVIPYSNAVVTAIQCEKTIAEHKPNLAISSQYTALAKELLPQLNGGKFGKAEKIREIKGLGDTPMFT